LVKKLVLTKQKSSIWFRHCPKKLDFVQKTSIGPKSNKFWQNTLFLANLDFGKKKAINFWQKTLLLAKKKQ